MSEQRVTRVAAYAVCHDPDGRVLLCRIAPGYGAAGRWTLPGGGIDFGEDPTTAVLRELAEETGIGGRVSEVLGVDSWVRTFEDPEGWRTIHGFGILYRVEPDGVDVRGETDGSTDACEWFTGADARRLPLVDLASNGLRLVRDRGPVPA